MNYTTPEDLIKAVADAMFPIETNGVVKTGLTMEVINLPGFTMMPAMQFLNRLCSHGDCQYLEFGTWAGRSLCAAASNNTGRFVGVDLFEGWPGWQDDTGRQKVWPAQRKQMIHPPNVEYVEADFRTYKPSGPLNVFLYDADHSIEATKEGILQIAPFLSPGVLLVDDCYWPSVREGINQAMDVYPGKLHLATHLQTGEGLFVAVVDASQ